MVFQSLTLGDAPICFFLSRREEIEESLAGALTALEEERDAHGATRKGLHEVTSRGERLPRICFVDVCNIYRKH